MRLSIHRDSPVPLHDQLVTQLALQIATGALAPGAKLPSLRALEARLGMHRNTIQAAYQTLAGYGLVAIAPGSGAQVSLAPPNAARTAEAALMAAARGWVAQARAAGMDEGAVRRAFEAAIAPPPARRLVFVDSNPDFHPVYAAELALAGIGPVEAVTPEALAQGGFEDALVVATPYHHAAASAAAPALSLRLVPVAPPEAELARLAALPDGASVGVVSASTTLRALVAEIVAGARGEAIAMLEADPADADGVKAVCRLSVVVLADAAAAPFVKGYPNVIAYRLFSDAQIEALRAALAP